MMANTTKDSLIILSCNVRGLNSKYKQWLFQYLKLHNPHIVLLQETHCIGIRIMALKKIGAEGVSCDILHVFSWVSILISKNLPCTIHDVHLDPKGKFLIYHSECLFTSFQSDTATIPIVRDYGSALSYTNLIHE